MKYTFTFIFFIFILLFTEYYASGQNGIVRDTVLNKSEIENFQIFDPMRVYIKLRPGMEIDLSYNINTGFVSRVARQQFESYILPYQVIHIYRTFQHLKNSHISGIYTVTLADSALLESFINDIRNHAWIEYSERVPLYQLFLTPNDSLYDPNQKYLHNLNADSAWNISTGSTAVKVAIVDDAVQTNHEDLIAQIWHNPGEIAGDSIDNDLNGYVDDTTGYDVADNDNDVNPPSYLFKHGTAVAGVAGASSNNSIGVASVGFNISLIPIKTKKNNSPGGIIDSAMAGVEYAVVAGADVINMSFGSAIYSQVFQDLCLAAHDSGIVLVASAGNSGGYHYFYPAAYDGVISVGATNDNFHVSVFSTYNDSVDVMAPGLLLLTTACAAGGDSYDYFTGTSASAPLVAGTAALMLANNPAMTPDEVETCIENGAVNIYHENQEVFVGKIGSGRLDVYGALACIEMPQPPPSCSGNPYGVLICKNSPLTLDGHFFFPNDTYFEWIFPGGVPQTFIGANPTVQYPYFGTYDIILIHGSSPSNVDTTWLNDYVLVLAFSAYISPSGTQEVCENELAYVKVIFDHGYPPYTICITDGVTIDTISGLAGPDYSFPVLMDTIHTYYLIWATDLFCTSYSNTLLKLVPGPCSECMNVSFEHNDFIKWAGKLGYCCGNPDFIPGLTSERMKITSALTFDPHSQNSVLITDTTDGNFHSAKLGNWFVGKESESLLRNIYVTPDNAILRVRYAVFLEDPYGHAPPDKPKFSVTVADTNGSVLPGACTHYQVTSGLQTLNWQLYHHVRYTDWQTLMVDLSPYLNQTVQLNFTTEDCGHGGHFGYAYIDAECLPMEVMVHNYCDTTGFISIEAPGGFESYLWDPTGDTTQTISLYTWNPGDSIMVTMTNQLGCTTSIIHVLQVLSAPVPDVSLTDTTICAQQTVMLTAQGAGVGGTYHWESMPAGFMASGDTVFVTPSDTTVYYVFAENVYQCESLVPDSATVHVLTQLDFDLTPSVFICKGDSVTFTAPTFSDSVSYNWSSFPPFFTDTGAVVVYQPDYAVYVILTVSDSLCSYSDTTHVGFYPLMQDQPITYAYICDSTTIVTLDTPAGSTDWHWIPTGDTTSSITIINPVLFSIFQVAFTSSEGCVDTMRFIISTMPPPDAKAGSDTTICRGYSISITGSGSTSPQATYHWISIPAGFVSDAQTVWVSPDSTTMYILEVTNGTICPGSSFDTIVVTVNEPPMIDLGPDIEACLGQPVNVSQTQVPGMNFWQSNPAGFISQDDFITFVPYQNTTLYVTVFVGNCFNTDSIQILVVDTPKVLTDSSMLKACFLNDSTALLTVPPGYDYYYWLQFDTVATQLVVTGLQSNQYFTILVHEPGSLCHDTIVITWEDETINDSMMISYLPANVLCEGDSLWLEAWPQSDSLLYSWFLNSDTIPSATHYYFNLIPAADDSVIHLELSNGYCYLYDSLVIQIDQALPVFPMDDVSLCPGDSLWWIIPDSIHQNIIWENGLHDSIRLITQSGLYSVQVTNGYCSWTDSAQIEVLAVGDDFFVPNVVTPNADGFNDELCFVAPLSDDFDIVVFNRWGNKVYESIDPEACWDLFLNGARISDGTYFYIAHYRSQCKDEIIEHQGTISVISKKD